MAFPKPTTMHRQCTFRLLLGLLAVAATATPANANDASLDVVAVAFEEASQGNWEEVFWDPGTGDWKNNWFLDGEVGVVTSGAARHDAERRAGVQERRPSHGLVDQAKL